MYKFVTIQAGCGESGYSITKCEEMANKMHSMGYDLVQVYQTTTAGCGGANSALTMVFKKQIRESTGVRKLP